MCPHRNTVRGIWQSVGDAKNCWMSEREARRSLRFPFWWKSLLIRNFFPSTIDCYCFKIKVLWSIMFGRHRYVCFPLFYEKHCKIQAIDRVPLTHLLIHPSHLRLCVELSVDTTDSKITTTGKELPPWAQNSPVIWSRCLVLCPALQVSAQATFSYFFFIVL